MKTSTALALPVYAIMGVAMLALPTLAQTDSELPAGPKPAIASTTANPPSLPVPGRTSFTADEAKARMIKRGYNVTSNPLKDDNGIWYAEGQRDGHRVVMVMVDYQGNVYEGGEYTGHPSSAPGLEPTNNPPVKPVNPQQR